MEKRQTRRDVMKLTSTGLAAAIVESSVQGQTPEKNTPAAGGEISVRVTEGSNRFAEVPRLRWRPQHGSSADSIVVDPNIAFQEMLGFGAAMTDAACYMLSQVPSEPRERLLHELFHSSQMNLDVCRVCIGASDYARNAYSFDEGAPDPEMKRFSIDHDREYILPMLASARKENPDLFLLASPWSPPGWMKESKTMLGGCMLKSSYAPYAKYFVRFLQAYSEASVPVNAVTVQNEVDTNQDGRMPACQWGQEYEVEFVGQHLGPQLAENRLDTKIWVIDHNYNLWGRAICELDDPTANKYIDGIAWHGYLGEPAAMTRVHDAHPDKHAYWTEGGPAYTDPAYRTDWAQWGTTFAGILRNWARCIIGWNMALDERGRPNIGPFSCGGVVTIDSKTSEVTRSGQYWAFAHYSRAIRRGARRIESSGNIAGVSHVAFTNPGGGKAAVLTNAATRSKRILLQMSGMECELMLPANSISTLNWA